MQLCTAVGCYLLARRRSDSVEPDRSKECTTRSTLLGGLRSASSCGTLVRTAVGARFMVRMCSSILFGRASRIVSETLAVSPYGADRGHYCAEGYRPNRGDRWYDRGGSGTARAGRQVDTQRVDVPRYGFTAEEGEDFSAAAPGRGSSAGSSAASPTRSWRLVRRTPTRTLSPPRRCWSATFGSGRCGRSSRSSAGSGSGCPQSRS
jgi:hypothetical protein